MKWTSTDNYRKSMKNAGLKPKHHFALPVTLEGSSNPYLKYPCKGVLVAFEQGVDLSIICGVFRQLEKDGSLSAPCEVNSPTFRYDS